MTSRLIRPKP